MLLKKKKNDFTYKLLITKELIILKMFKNINFPNQDDLVIIASHSKTPNMQLSPGSPSTPCFMYSNSHKLGVEYEIPHPHAPASCSTP